MSDDLTDRLQEHAAPYTEPDVDLVERARRRLEWRRRRGFKVCARCSERKPASGFGVDSSRRDGLRRYCRVCVAAYDAGKRS